MLKAGETRNFMLKLLFYNLGVFSFDNVTTSTTASGGGKGRGSYFLSCTWKPGAPLQHGWCMSRVTSRCCQYDGPRPPLSFADVRSAADVIASEGLVTIAEQKQQLQQLQAAAAAQQSNVMPQAQAAVEAAHVLQLKQARAELAAYRAQAHAINSSAAETAAANEARHATLKALLAKETKRKAKAVARVRDRSRQLKYVRVRYAYSVRDLRELRKAAASLEAAVIPLQQSLQQTSALYFQCRDRLALFIENGEKALTPTAGRSPERSARRGITAAAAAHPQHPHPHPATARSEEQQQLLQHYAAHNGRDQDRDQDQDHGRDQDWGRNGSFSYSDSVASGSLSSDTEV